MLNFLEGNYKPRQLSICIPSMPMYRYEMVPNMTFCFGFDALGTCGRREWHMLSAGLSKRVQPNTAGWLEMSISRK